MQIRGDKRPAKGAANLKKKSKETNPRHDYSKIYMKERNLRQILKLLVKEEEQDEE